MPDNPYASAAALEHSRYYQIKDGRAAILSESNGSAESQPALELFASTVIGAFRGFVLDPMFSCVGAKSAIAHETVRFGVYERLGSPSSSAGLAHDLFTFTREPAEFTEADYITFVAIFREPAELDEKGFEHLLWEELRQLNRMDGPLHPWDPAVSPDPDDPHFAFSFAGTAFFVVGLHPHSSRTARRFPWPALVFNPHAQFERLKETLSWEKMQEVIRDREQKLQGSLNPNLAEHGEVSEARQYSGRPVEPNWHAPTAAPTSRPPISQPSSTAGRGCPFPHLHSQPTEAES